MSTKASMMSSARAEASNGIESTHAAEQIPRISTFSALTKVAHFVVRIKRNWVLDPNHEKEVQARLMNKLVYQSISHACDPKIRTLRWKPALLSLESILGIVTVVCLAASLSLKGVKHRTFLGFPLWNWIFLALVALWGRLIINAYTLALVKVLELMLPSYQLVFFFHMLKSSVSFFLWVALLFFSWMSLFDPHLIRDPWRVSHLVAFYITWAVAAVLLGAFLWICKDILYLYVESNVLFHQQFFKKVRKAALSLHGMEIINDAKIWPAMGKKEDIVGAEDGSHHWRLVSRCYFSHSERWCRPRHLLAAGTLPQYYRREEKIRKSTRDDEQATAISIDKEKKKNTRDDDKDVEESFWVDIYLLKRPRKAIPTYIVKRLAELFMLAMEKPYFLYGEALLKDDEKLLAKAQCNMERFVLLQDHYNKQKRSYKVIKGLEMTRAEVHDLIQCWMNEHREQHSRANQERIKDEELLRLLKAREKFLNWAVVAYRSCWGLRAAVLNMERALMQLNGILSGLIIAGMIVLWVLATKTASASSVAVLLISPFLGTTFVFGDFFKTVYQSLIFSLVIHPFDIGDRVVIDDMQMRVTDMNILSTVFLKYHTKETVVYANSVLVTKNMRILSNDNLDQDDKLEFHIDGLTSMENIKHLEITIKKLVNEDPKYSKCDGVKKEYGKEIKMEVPLKYSVSYLDSNMKANLQSKLLTNIMEVIHKLKHKDAALSDNGWDGPSVFTFIALQHCIKSRLSKRK